MPCYHPLDAYQSNWKKPNGKSKVIVIGKKNSSHPTIDMGKYKKIQVPCGQCIGCRLNRSIQWALRCQHEMMYHDVNSFITLTYDDNHIPTDNSLNHTHFQKFLKRLRKKIYPKKIKFFMCGEYGDQTWRPHYHAILFGEDFSKDRLPMYIGATEKQSWRSPTLNKLWPFGLHQIDEANFSTAAYVARYISKKVNGEMAEDHYTRDIVEIEPVTGEVLNLQEQVKLKPEYATMSNGIGKNFFNEYKASCYPSNFLVHNGHKLGIPKYYDYLLEMSEPELLEQMKKDRLLKIEDHANDLTPERLLAREACKKAQSSSLQRNKI